MDTTHRTLLFVVAIIVASLCACSSDRTGGDWQFDDGLNDAEGERGETGTDADRVVTDSDRSPDPDADSADPGDPSPTEHRCPDRFTRCGTSSGNVQTGVEEDRQCVGEDGEWYCTCAGSLLRDGDIRGPDCSGPSESSAESCLEAMAEVCGTDADPDVCRIDWDGRESRCDALPDGTWRCACDEGAEPIEVDADDCREALASCMPSCSNDAGVCQPGDELGYYSCQCDGLDAWRRTPGIGCEFALEAACATDDQCSSNGDTCIPDKETGEFHCQCTSYYDASRTVNAANCEDAIRTACNPADDYCNGWSGFCDRIEDGYLCECLDDTGGTVLHGPSRFGGYGSTCSCVTVP
ncbi:MAG: hypothetical protein ACF8LL_09400, partial [Phycisphaerales bacterium]